MFFLILSIQTYILQKGGVPDFKAVEDKSKANKFKSLVRLWMTNGHSNFLFPLKLATPPFNLFNFLTTPAISNVTL